MTTTSDSVESRKIAMRLPPTATEQQEQLPCPRCDSTNTKFCYYNNYNFSQPRHFCKSCRRYWTHGGTLRDIPVGGGTRKSAKRSSAGTLKLPLQATPVLFPQSSSISNGVSHTVTENDGKGSALSLCGSFTSLLSQNGNAATAIGTGGFGVGLGSGFDDVSFGLGRAVWPFSTLGDAATRNVVSNGGHHAVPLPDTWQFESTNGVEYFAWPDLSINTPVSSHK